MEDLGPRAGRVAGYASGAAWLAAAALAIAGCGTSAGEKDVSTAVHDYLDQVATGQADRACARLTPGARARMQTAFRGGNCAALVTRTRARIGGGADLKEADVKVLSVSGSSARVRVYLNNRREEAPLEKRQGVWRINRFDLVSSLYGLNP